MAVSENPVYNVGTTYVPAWKRIGLKLKYAKDTTNEISSQSASAVNSTTSNDVNAQTNQTHDEDSELHVRKAKKRKISSESGPESPRLHANAPNSHGISHEHIDTTDNGGLHADSANAPELRPSKEHPTSSPSKKSKAIARRKSVTFTSDTKDEDGFSAARLFQEWSAQDEAANPRDPPKQLPTLADTISSRTPKQRKQTPSTTKSSKSVVPEVSDPSAVPATLEYVQYLQHFYTDKPSWKFNKKKQKDLLKNLYNIYRIPPRHNEALIAYIAGLQGFAVQQRLLESAETVLKSMLERQGRAEEAQMDSREGRKAAYEAALQRELDKLDQIDAGPNEYDDDQIREMHQEYERSKRAEAVLSELLTKELAPPAQAPHAQSIPTPQPKPAARYTKFEDDNEQIPDASNTAAKPASAPNAKPGKRKRKSRTEVSSSSESDSSSDSSSSESEGD